MSTKPKDLTPRSIRFSKEKLVKVGIYDIDLSRICREAVDKAIKEKEAAVLQK